MYVSACLYEVLVYTQKSIQKLKKNKGKDKKIVPSREVKCNKEKQIVGMG